MLNRVERFIQECSGFNLPKFLQTYSKVHIETTMFAQTIACRCGALWEHFRKTWLAPVTSSCVFLPTTSTESWLKRAAVAATIWKRCSKQIWRGLGRMVAILDTWDQPTYLTRVWTVYEQFVASTIQIEATVGRCWNHPSFPKLGSFAAFWKADEDRWRQYRSAYFTLLKHFFRLNRLSTYTSMPGPSRHMFFFQIFPPLVPAPGGVYHAKGCIRSYAAADRTGLRRHRWGHRSYQSGRLGRSQSLEYSGWDQSETYHAMGWFDVSHTTNGHPWWLLCFAAPCWTVSKEVPDPGAGREGRRLVRNRYSDSWYGSWTTRAMAVFRACVFGTQESTPGVRLHVHGTSIGTFNEVFYQVGLQV